MQFWQACPIFFAYSLKIFHWTCKKLYKFPGRILFKTKIHLWIHRMQYWQHCWKFLARTSKLPRLNSKKTNNFLILWKNWFSQSVLQDKWNPVWRILTEMFRSTSDDFVCGPTSFWLFSLRKKLQNRTKFCQFDQSCQIISQLIRHELLQNSWKTHFFFCY